MDIIERLGGVSAVARLTGCKPPSVMEWRQRGIPLTRCPDIERLSEGRVPCEMARADVPWQRVPDPNWPWHPQGRPLVDLTRMGAGQRLS